MGFVLYRVLCLTAHWPIPQVSKSLQLSGQFFSSHGGGPIGSQSRHQNRLFLANVVLFRRTYWSYRREREGG